MGALTLRARHFPGNILGRRGGVCRYLRVVAQPAGRPTGAMLGPRLGGRRTCERDPKISADDGGTTTPCAGSLGPVACKAVSVKKNMAWWKSFFKNHIQKGQPILEGVIFH